LYLEHIQRSGLAWRGRDPRNALSGEGVEQAGFPDIGAAEEGDFGKRKIEGDVGPGEGADEAGTRQASFF
jgi:hypothetical protein